MPDSISIENVVHKNNIDKNPAPPPSIQKVAVQCKNSPSSTLESESILDLTIENVPLYRGMALVMVPMKNVKVPMKNVMVPMKK